ncbi:MAG TPA: SWIM zinc finger family protein [Candidatus Corynebacterium avicola]|uniref:SWIM zinc finger family protein n=1 Tax=Candidatus Corynebacterium avicola TaxID=2838527 RepID=A0A9D1RM49_9CORY|nr:SWIM zinc finger family protein [Candidatus Corynebacterium avicola]
MSDRRKGRNDQRKSRLGTPQPQWGDNVISADFSRGRAGTSYFSTVSSRKPEPSAELPQDSDLSKDSWSATMVMRTVTSLTDSGRLSRGRTVFRSRSLLHFDAELGLVTGMVQGTQLEPFEVQVKWRPLSPRQMDYITGELDDHPENLRLLLSGSRPSTDVSAELFSVDQFVSSWCTCPDHSKFCKHRVALCYALAAKFSADPLAFLSWRGFDPEELLERMRRRAAERPRRRPEDVGDADASADRNSPECGESTEVPETSEAPASLDAPTEPGNGDAGDTERYRPEEFWGDVATVPQWDDFAVEHGLELGDPDIRNQAIRRFSWNNVDQLRVLHSLERCYETLTEPSATDTGSERVFEREPWLSEPADRNGDHD